MTQAPTPADRRSERARLAAAAAAHHTRNNVIACAGFTILSLLGAFFYAPVWWEKLDIQRHSAPTEATLDNEYVERISTRNGVRTVSYAVTFAYTVAGAQYHGSGTIEQQPRSTMQVFYDTRQPGSARIEGLEDFHFSSGILGFLIIVAVASVIGFLVFHARWRVLRALAA